jgi:GH35 family endo-1,4-beta-xylanase
MSNYKHRQGSAIICVLGEDGLPLANKEINIHQKTGSVLFGAAGFEAINLVNGDYSGIEKEYTEKRVEKMMDIFDFITLPFYWGRFEPEQGKPITERTLKGARWLQERGKIVKGHPLCWHTVCAPWLIENDFSDADILKLQLERIKRDVTDFAGVIDVWDVINEVVIMPVFDRYDNGVTRICKSEGQIGLVKKVFDEAKKANPNATLLINDFDMSTDYSFLLSELLDANIPIDAIGLQSHMHQGNWSKEKTEEILERFSKFGLPLHFTEINLVSGELMPEHIVDLNDFVPDQWVSTPEGEARQAEQASEFYKWLYNCPLVEAVTYWSFCDGGWLNAPAGLMTKDARVKPVYDALYNLIKKEWMTPDMTIKTNDKGEAEIKGFKGAYTATYDGVSMSFDIN